MVDKVTDFLLLIGKLLVVGAIGKLILGVTEPITVLSLYNAIRGSFNKE